MATPGQSPSPTTNVPEYPSRSSVVPGGESAYVTATDTADQNLPLWNTSLNALDSNVSANATIAYNNANEASASASAAQDAANLAEGASNFSGAWSSLTGPQSAGITATNGTTTTGRKRTWRLDVNLADVTLSEPGVSGDWTEQTSVRGDGDNTFTGTNDFQAQVTEKSVTVTSTANSLVIDCSLGNSFVHTLTENTMLSFVNIPPSGQYYDAKIRIIQDAGASGFAVTFATAEWDDGTLPTLTATASAVDEILYYTEFGGTPWCAKQVGKNKVSA